MLWEKGGHQQSQVHCDKRRQGGIHSNLDGDSAATWHERVKRPAEKSGKALLAEETAYAETMRHRGLGDRRASGETIYVGHLGTGGIHEDGSLSPAPPPTPTPESSHS